MKGLVEAAANGHPTPFESKYPYVVCTQTYIAAQRNTVLRHSLF